MNDSIQYLGKLLDVTAVRQRVLANNLANSNTPGYVRKDVSFKDTLTNAVKSDDPDSLASYQPQIVEDRKSEFKENGNNVSSQKSWRQLAITISFTCLPAGLLAVNL